MTPLVGSKAWFGPRRFGWGLEPVSVEGWATTAAFAGLAAWAVRRSLKGPVAWLLVGAYVALAVAKGTAPGGPRARQALTAEGAPD
jgi:hypothetical protein